VVCTLRGAMMRAWRGAGLVSESKIDKPILVEPLPWRLVEGHIFHIAVASEPANF
jgi:hypothetical protein